MKFSPGQSGNPAGRPRGPRAPSEAKLRGDLLQKAPEIITALLEQATNGDVAAAKALLDRCLPPLRAIETPAPIPLGSLADAPARIVAGVEQGLLTPGQAASLASAVAALTRTLEVIDFEARLAALEAPHAHP